MITMTTTGYVLVGTCIVDAIYDFIACKSTGNANYSISNYIRTAAIKHPMLMVVAGVLIGHFFAPLIQK